MTSRRRAGVLAALVGLTLSALALSALAAAPAGQKQARMLLRLYELPRQYRIGDDSGCGAYGPPESEVSESLERWMAQGAAGCVLQYERLFRLPGVRSAQVVETEAIKAPSLSSAEEGFALAAELTDFAHGDGFAPAPGPAPNLGDAATLLRHDDTLVFGKTGRSASVLFWRSGRILGSIYVGGPRHRLGDRLALRLARLQQRHVEHPAPYTEAQQDWTTVPLDNPGIRFPIYWLGRDFSPGAGLTTSKLYDAYAWTGPSDGLPGTKTELEYGDFTIRSWSKASWRLYDRDPILGPLLRGWHCTEKRVMSFADRELTIYAGYTKDFKDCPPRRPNVHAAEVRLGGMVIGIGLPHCLYCIETDFGPYASPRGLEAIARGLRVRRTPN